MGDDDHGRPFFLIDGEFDPNEGEPADGFTFLKAVRWEANRLEHVNVSDVNPRQYDAKQTRTYAPNKSTATAASDDRIPSKLWRKSLLDNVKDVREEFFAFRQSYEDEEEDSLPAFKYPEWKDERGWQEFFFGEKALAKYQDPLISHLVRFDEVSIIRLLKLHIKWSTSTTISWSESRLQWLFSLLVCLDLPIEPALQADLCGLRKTLCTLRQKTDILEKDTMAGINMSITLLEDLFGQREF